MLKRSRLWFLLLIAAIAAAGFSPANARRAPRLVTAATPIDAKPIYDSKCASCHGKDGRAKSLHAKHVHAREFTDAAWQADGHVCRCRAGVERKNAELQEQVIGRSN